MSTPGSPQAVRLRSSALDPRDRERSSGVTSDKQICGVDTHESSLDVSPLVCPACNRDQCLELRFGREGCSMCMVIGSIEYVRGRPNQGGTNLHSII